MDNSVEGTGQTKVPVADQTIAYCDSTGKNIIVMRSGRFAATVTLNTLAEIQAKTGIQDLNTYIGKLMPYLQQLDAKLKTLQ